MAARETLIIEIEVDLKNQGAIAAFAALAQAELKKIADGAREVTVAAQSMNTALASQRAGSGLAKAARSAGQVAESFKIGAQQAQSFAFQAAKAGDETGKFSGTLKQVFQNAILGFQVAQVGFKNFGQGFQSVFKIGADLSRNLFRSFQGISTEGQTIFGKLASIIGSSLQGAVILAGNFASNVIKALSEIPKAIGAIFGGLAQIIGSAFIFAPGLVAKTAGVFISGFGNLAKAIGDIFSGLISTVGTIFESISRTISGALGVVTAVVRTIVDQIAGIFEGLVSKVAAVLGTVADIAGKTFLAIGGAAAVGAGIILRDFGTLQEGVNRTLGAIGDASDATREQLTGFAQDLRRQFGVGAKEATDALFLAFTSGARSTTEALEVTQQAFKLTAVFGGDIKSAVEALTRTFQTYRGEVTSVTEVSDLLAKTVQVGLADFGELSQSLGIVTGTAAAAGIPLKELLEVLSVLTQRLSVPLAVTSLNRFIDSLTAAGPDAEKLRAELGIVFQDFNPEVTKSIAALEKQKAALEESIRAFEEQGSATRKASLFLKDAKDELKEFDRQIDLVKRQTGTFIGLQESIRKVFETIKSGAASPRVLAELFPEVRARRAVIQAASAEGIIGLGEAVKVFADATGSLQGAFDVVAAGIGFKFRQLVQDALTLGDTLAAAFGPTAGGAIEEFQRLLAGANAQLVAFIKTPEGKKFFADLAADVRNFVSHDIPAAFNAVKGFISDSIREFQKLSAFVAPIFAKIVDEAGHIFDAFSQGPSFQEVFGKLLDGDFGPLGEKISAVLGALNVDPLIRKLIGIGEGVAASIGEALLHGFDVAVPAIISFADKVRTEIGAAFQAASDFVNENITIRNISRILVEGIISAVPAIISALGTVILAFAKGLGNAIIGAIEGAGAGITTLAQKFNKTIGLGFLNTNQAPPPPTREFIPTREAAQKMEDLLPLSELGDDFRKTSTTVDQVDAAVKKWIESMRTAAEESDRVSQAQAAMRASQADLAEGYRLATEETQRQSDALAVLAQVGNELELGDTIAEIKGFIDNLTNLAGQLTAGLGLASTPKVRSQADTEAANKAQAAIDAAAESIRRADAERAHQDAEKASKILDDLRQDFLDAFAANTETIKSELEKLIDVSTKDIASLATVTKHHASFTLQGVHEAQEQKRIAQGTLKGIGLLADVFARLGPNESAVFDPTLLANALGVEQKDLISTLLQSFKLLFGKTPSGGALGGAATAEAEGFLSSRSAQTALKLLGKDAIDAGAAFRGLALTKGGVTEFTTQLLGAAETVANNTGDFTALSQVTEGLQKQFGDLATALESFGLSKGAAAGAAQTGDFAAAIKQASADFKVSASSQKNFLKGVEQARSSGDLASLKKSLDKLQDSFPDFGTTGSKGKLTKDQQFQQEVLLKAIKDITGGKGEAAKQDLGTLEGIKSPVEVRNAGAPIDVFVSAVQAGTFDPIVIPIVDIKNLLQVGFLDLLNQMDRDTTFIDDTIRKCCGEIIVAIHSIPGAGGGKGPAAAGAGLDLIPQNASGGVTRRDFVSKVHQGELIAPLGGFYAQLGAFLKAGFRSITQSSRAGLSSRPTAVRSSADATGDFGSTARLSSLEATSQSFSRSASRFAQKIEAHASATERALQSARTSFETAGETLDLRTRGLEKITAEERGKNRRARRTIGHSTQAFPSLQ